MKTIKKQKNIYCFDTSAFVTLSRANENIIEIPKSLWDYLEKMMKAGIIISHRIVFDEISSNSKNPDFITKWIANKRSYFLDKTPIQIKFMPNIVRQCPWLIDYKMEREQADPWLIALAIEKSKDQTIFDVTTSIVVSQENPNSSKKIPAACGCFNIKHLSLRKFFDEMGLKTNLIKN